MTPRCPHCWFTGIEETCRTPGRIWFHCTGCGLRWSGVVPAGARTIEPHPRVTHEPRPRTAHAVPSR